MGAKMLVVIDNVYEETDTEVIMGDDGTGFN
jgi:hypothetical protein